MAATSVTGTGPGESFGKPKPQNNAGCCSGCKEDEEIKKKIIKSGCHISYKTTGNTAIKIGQSKTIRVC